MAELFGDVEGCCRGRGGSMHIFDRARRFYGGRAIVGGGIPTAVGLALADAMRGNRAITACAFGDGAAAEGAFHESLNLAVLWRVPVLFLCENNRYAMGTRVERELSATDISARASSYGLVAESVDGMDVFRGRRGRSAGGRCRADAAMPPIRRAPHLSLPRALDVRPRAVPRPRRGRALAPARPHRAADGSGEDDARNRRCGHRADRILGRRLGRIRNRGYARARGRSAPQRDWCRSGRLVRSA